MMEDVGATEEQWDNSPELTVKEKRGEFLSIVTALSWISQGMATSSALMMLLLGRENLEKQVDVISKSVAKGGSGNSFLDNALADTISLLEITIMNFTQINLVNVLVAATGALGVLMMYKLNKIGFLIYLIYCCAELFVIYYF